MTGLITEARELCEKATPGPWEEGYGKGVTGPTSACFAEIKNKSGMGMVSKPGEVFAGEFYSGVICMTAIKRTYDATFIARSRTLIPELCDALEKAEAELIHYHHLQKVTEGQKKQNQRLRRQLEKAEEQNKQLMRELCKLACESVEREKTLARLEAEVMVACNSVRWVPVTERLPEEPYGCLVIVEQDDYWGEPREVMYPHFAGYDGEQWNDGDGDKVPLEITRWMPLPEPPKGERSRA